MSDFPEFQALAQSIGEMTKDTIGEDDLQALQVFVDVRDRVAHVRLALRRPDDDVQKRVLRELFDIEKVYLEDVAMAFDFVGPAEFENEAELSNASVYSHAFA
jgi:hypothetical protein